MQNGILLGGFLSALAISLLAIPSIIKVAISKGLYGVQRDKGSRGRKVPTLGGLAIFAGVLIPLSLLADFSELPVLPYLIAGALLLFFIGLKDDILIIAPWWKLLGQFLVALVVCMPGRLRIMNPGGLMGLGPGNEAFSILITVLGIVAVINSYNLIDGIDGLAAGIGLLASAVFGIVFYLAELQVWTLMAVIFSGSLAGFAWYNVFSPTKKIYMGDTGSLLLGFLMSLMAVRILNIEEINFLNLQVKIPLAFVLAVLIVPLFDLLRIIIIRIFQRRSPLSPDRNHIHYRLVDAGLSHLQSTGVLLGVNLVIIALVLFIQGAGEIPAILLLLAAATILSLLPGIYIRKKNKL
ncbi:MAG TPA: undecaprenyl/decaprenyl-phosphate alpha-N-acetylglucosaminyl 1-phosphate transferase [Bacteroides sp.]|nr:undecaprenyl/decaprenyl-phosphate alpha-N-acetylglucosaminyl 1-phosphate transferase [Bacteroides sp.]